MKTPLTFPRSSSAFGALAIAVLTWSAFGLDYATAQETTTPSADAVQTAPPVAEPAAAEPTEAERLAAWLAAAYGDSQPPESVRMLIAIARGSNMGSGEGWFGPCESRYGWMWLAGGYGVPLDGSLPRESFSGPSHWYDRLDRNRDGRIAAEDLDWSDRNPYVQHAYMVNRLFRRMDLQGDGRLTRDDLNAFFDLAAGGQDHLTSDSLRDTMLAGFSGAFFAGDAPSTEQLVRGLFAAEIGSLNEGPDVDDPAPDFRLRTPPGDRVFQLSELIGAKPVVLVFGNYTCGPFRAMYPGVDQVYERFKDDAHFLGVYVREAHPTDGWAMESNSRSGVAVRQPVSFEERVAVAGEFCSKLNPAIPFVVDEINDPVGNAYSGMPARLYVIDVEGKVAYKSGRGPFGFRAGEMEQSLVMTLLDRAGGQTAALPPE